MSNKRYLIVDKETGEVVHESDTPFNPPKYRVVSPFRTFLSWMSLIACGTAFYYLATYFLRFVFWLRSEILGLNRALYILLLLLEGCTVLGVAIYGTLLCSAFTVTLSEKLSPSRNGTRYIVIPLIFAIYYAAVIAMIAIGIIISESNAFLYILCGLMLVYFLFVCLSGKSESQRGKHGN